MQCSAEVLRAPAVRDVTARPTRQAAGSDGAASATAPERLARDDDRHTINGFIHLLARGKDRIVALGSTESELQFPSFVGQSPGPGSRWRGIQGI